MHAWVSSVSLCFLYDRNSGKTTDVLVRGVMLQGLEHGWPGQEIRSFQKLDVVFM